MKSNAAAMRKAFLQFGPAEKRKLVKDFIPIEQVNAKERKKEIKKRAALVKGVDAGLAQIHELAKQVGMKTTYGGIDFSYDLGICMSLWMIERSQVADVDGYAREIDAAIKGNDPLAAFWLGHGLATDVSFVLNHAVHKQIYEARTKSDGARQASTIERNKAIVDEMRDKIVKRGNRKQPSNQRIRQRLAEEYNLKFRQIMVITKEFNRKK